MYAGSNPGLGTSVCHSYGSKKSSLSLSLSLSLSIIYTYTHTSIRTYLCTRIHIHWNLVCHRWDAPSLCVVHFVFCFLGVHPRDMEVPWARGWRIGAVAAGLHLSQSYALPDHPIWAERPRLSPTPTSPWMKTYFQYISSGEKLAKNHFICHGNHIF